MTPRLHLLLLFILLLAGPLPFQGDSSDNNGNRLLAGLSCASAWQLPFNFWTSKHGVTSQRALDHAAAPVTSTPAADGSDAALDLSSAALSEPTPASAAVSSSSASSAAGSRGRVVSKTARKRASSSQEGLPLKRHAGDADADGVAAEDEQQHQATAAQTVTFSAGRIPVDVNPAGNATALLLLDEANAAATLPDAQLALRELLLSNRLPHDPTKPYKRPAVSYNDSDFVFATGSYPARYLLAQSTRAWRRVRADGDGSGSSFIRAFIAVNNTEDLPVLNERNAAYGERYGYFPDEGSGELGESFHGSMRGDSRAALAPFMAHKYFGESYKWMLYGDDDTLFYMAAVKRLVSRLDPDLPYAISDNLWYRTRHPNLFAPRCLPCHLAVDADPPARNTNAANAGGGSGDGSGIGGGGGGESRRSSGVRIPNVTELVEGYGRFLVGASSQEDMSSPAVKRRMRNRGYIDFARTQARLAALVAPDASVPGLRYAPRPACPFCTAEAACTPAPPAAAKAACSPSGGYGGAGVIFSVGLLRRLSMDRIKACIKGKFRAPGGDALLFMCLWEAGYAFTDPGSTTLALYDAHYVTFSSEAAKWALHDPLTVLLRGKCDTRCRWALRHAASHHGRGRHLQSAAQSAAYLYSNMASYNAAHKWMAFMAQRDEDLREVRA
ncbi:hypothetical protein Agub_g10815, partial [Astrephomene gubernaculifera]